MQAFKKSDRPRILVIDDDPGVRQSIGLMLERDYEIIEAESIAESIAAYDRQEPDLITLDVYMPEVDGMEGLDMFRKRSSKIPIILISGHHTFELAQQALRLGANDYLTKPFREEELRQTIQAALAKVGDEGSDLHSIDSDADFKMRLPLQNLKEDKFLSVQHRNYFLAFAQKALANKKPVVEEMYIRELVKTIDLQIQALRLTEKVACEIAHSNPSVRIKCDMYLLGGALANLAFTCMMGTRSDKSPMKVVFSHSGKDLQVLYTKSGLQLPEDVRVRFEHWHGEQKTSLDADTAMLALAEKVVHLHQGELMVNGSSGSLVEISLPMNPASG
jgi:CheY-like chemotaxis protein